MEDLLALALLGIIVEFALKVLRNYISPLLKEKTLNIALVILSVLVGVYYAWQTGRSLLMSLGLPVKWVPADVIITGLLVGAAGTLWHEFIAILRSIKEGKQAQTAVQNLMADGYTSSMKYPVKPPSEG